MAEQEVWGQETRVEVSKLVLSTNKLTDQVIRLLDAITGNFDDLIGQLTEATGAINGGVADLSVIKKDIEESIRKAQEDMGYVYQEFLTESTDIKGDISSVSGSVTQIKDSIEQLSTDNIFLTSKYGQLQGLSTSLQGEISLYKSQVGNLQQSVTSVDQHVEVLKAELQNVSEMTQGNAESASNFEALLNELSLRVTKMTEDTVTYTATAKDLVDKYNAMKSIADESSIRANEAIVLANQTVIDVSALNTSVFELQGIAEDIQSRITEYGSMADEINGKLATGTAEATSLKNFLETTTDDINNRLGYISSQISDANVKVNAINVRLDSVTSTLDGISALVGDMNTTVSQRLDEAMQVIEDARGIAPSLTSSIEDANASLINYTQSLSGAKADVDAIFESLHTYKTETDSVYERVTLQLDDLTAKTDALTVFVNTSTEQISAANNEMQLSVQHVDEVRERVELIANEVETTYLKKVDQAADSALIGGKDLSYLFHDDNAETKFAASPMLSQLKTDVANIQTLLSSDNSNLDTLQEIVDFIQVNKATLDSLTISNIAGLQTALDGKLAADANAVSASKWDAPRRITLGDALSGYVDQDGSGDVTLNASIVGIDKVPGLLDQLATKLDKTGVAADSLKLNGIDATRFFFGDDATNVKEALSSTVDELTQSGFYKTTDTNLSIIHMQKDVDNAVRIWSDPETKDLYYKHKTDGVWSSTTFNIMSNASRFDFNRLDNVPVFATRANTWAEVTDKPTVFTPDVHVHAWDEVIGKPTTFTPSSHSHLWDEVNGKPTTFTPSPHNHYSVISEGSVVEQTGTTEATYAGLSIADAVAGTAWVDGTRVGNVINAKGNTSSQLMISPNASNTPSIYVRGKLGEAESWSTWARVLTTADIITWDSIDSKPTTLAGFGITDGAPLSHVGAGETAHSAASTSVAGFMSSSDKTKLDGIAAGANAYVHPTGDGNLHVPMTGTDSDGYVLKAGATAGSMAWEPLTATDVGALPSTWVPIFADIAYKPTTLSGYGITDAQPLASDLTAIAGLAGTSGLLKKTAANTWALDTNTYLTANETITISGDATGTGSTAISLVLANSGATAGTYKSVTVDSKGRVTSGTNPTTLAEYGITDAAPSSHVGSTGTEHGVVTTSVAGFMSAADKTKLDGVANNANNYVHPTGNGNLHVPSNSGISQGACLASGSTPGTLNWVSSIWRSYGVTQLAKTTANNATYVGQYTKFLTVTLSSQYQDYTAEVTAMSAGNGTSYNQNSRLNIRIKQQNAFGSDPFIEVFQTQLTPVDKQRYFYSIVQNTPTTIVDFYVMNVESWNQINFFVQNDLLNGGSAAYLSAQAYVTTLPANAVEFSKNRLLTDSYHPLADALTTARTLTWTGDATGAMTFNGSANVTSALTLAATGVTAGNYKSVTVDAKGRVLSGTNPTTLAEYGITDAAPSSHVGATGTAHGVATTSVAGFMSAADKAKLDGIVSSGNVNTASTTNVPNLGSIAFVSRTISANSTASTINYGDWVAGSAFKVASINGGSATQACTGTWKALSYFVGVGGNSSEVIQYGLAIRVS